MMLDNSKIRFPVPRFSIFACALAILTISTTVLTVTAVQLHKFQDHLHASINAWLPLEQDSPTSSSVHCTTLLVYEEPSQSQQQFIEALGLRLGFADVSASASTAPLIIKNLTPENRQNGTHALLNSPLVRLAAFYSRKQALVPCTIGHYFVWDVASLRGLRLGLLSPDSDSDSDSDFIRSLPGGTFRSFHVVYTRSTEERPDWHKYSGLLKRMHHFVILSRRNKVFTYNVWFNATNEISLYSATLFPDKWRDLQGAHVLVGATPGVTQEQLEDYARTNIIKQGGYSVSGAYEIMKHLNTTPRFSSEPGCEFFGHRDPRTGKWLGLVGHVLEEKVIFAFAMGLTYERARVLLYSRGYHFDRVVFLTPLPRPTSSGESAGSLDFLSRPFQGPVWAATGGAFLVIYAVLLITKYVDVDEGVRSRSKLDTVSISFALLQLLLRPISDQPSNTPNLQAKLRDNTTRFVFVHWLFLIFVLSGNYKSSFISMLLAPSVVYSPRTFAELADSDYVIGATLYNESYIGSKFMALNNSLGRAIDRKVVGFDVFDPAAYLPVADATKRQVCMGIQTYVEFGASTVLTSASGQSLFKTSEESLFPVTAGLVVSRERPHLLPTLDRIIARRFEMYVFQRALELERRYRAGEGRKLAGFFRPQSQGGGGDGSEAQGSQTEAAKRQGLIHFMVTLGVGLSLSTGIFLLEVTVYAFQRVVLTFKKDGGGSHERRQPSALITFSR